MALTGLRRALAHHARLVAARLGVPSDRDLVISFLFPPAAETAGIVMAKRLHDWPRDVDVIANEPPASRVPDPGTLRISGSRVKRVARVKGKRNRLKNWRIVERFCTEGDAAIREFERTRGPYRRVYSRAMMPASHFLAAQYKLRRPSVRWTAEFSDPLMYDTHGERRLTEIPGTPLVRSLVEAVESRGFSLADQNEMFELVETVAYALADEIVFTNPVQRDFMLAHIPDPALRERARARSQVRPHPSPAPALYDVVEPTIDLDPTRVNLAYFGAFYTLRGVGDLVAPLHLLTAQERARITLHVFTDKVDTSAQVVAELGLSDCVVVRGYVPFLEFLSITKRVDWLVLADARVTANHQVNPYLPSKLSDYRGSGTPIWALVEPGSPLSGAEGVTTTPLDDGDAAVEHLRTILAASPDDRHGDAG